MIQIYLDGVDGANGVDDVVGFVEYDDVVF